jgi:PAS domain S-box-containing protein
MGKKPIPASLTQAFAEFRVRLAEQAGGAPASQALLAELDGLLARLPADDLPDRLSEAEQATQRCHDRSREFIASIADCHYHIDRDWRIDEINDAAVQFFQKPHAEFIGHSVWELYPAGVDSLFQAEYLRAADTGQMVHFESPSRMVDRWAEVFAMPDEGGLSIYFRDITIRKHTEEALRETNHRLRSVLNSITEAYFVLDRQWRLVDFNRLAERNFLKRKPEDLLGHNFWDLFPQAVGGEYYRQYHRAFATGKPVHFEATFDQDPTWYEVHIYPRGENLEVYLHNIDTRKRAEQHMAYQASLLEHARESIIATDNQYRINAWNRAAEELYGWRAEEVVGRSIYEIIPLDNTPEQRESIFRQLNERGHYRAVMTQYTRDGRRIEIESNGILLHDDQGQPIGFTAINRDVTAQRALEQRLQQSRQELSDLIDSIRDGFTAVDRDYRILFINQKAAHIGGREPDGLVGQNIFAAFPIMAGGITEKLYREVMDSGEAQVQRIDSETLGRSFEIRVSPSPYGITVLTIDHTEERQAERERERLMDELQRQKDLISRLIEEVPAGISITAGPEHRYSLVNAAFRAIDRKRGRMIGRRTVDVWPDFDPTPLLDRVYQTGKPLHLEDAKAVFVNEADQPQERYFNFSVSPLLDADGQVEGTISVITDTTERVHARREREAERALLNAVVAHSTVAIAVVEGPEHRYRLANPAYRAISPDPQAEFIGRSALEVFPWLEETGGYREIDRVYQTGERVSIPEIRIPNGPNGEISYWSVEHIPLLDSKGRVQQVLILATDLTGAVQARRAIEAEHARLRAIVENAPEGIVLADAQARLVLTNPAAERLYNRPVPIGEEYDTHAQLEICHPDGTPYDPRDLPLTRSALDGERFENVEILMRWPDGEQRKMLVNTAPIRSSSGKISGAVGIFNDLTSLSEVQSALQLSEARMRVILDHMPVGVWLTDEQGNIVYGNPAGQDVWQGARYVGPDEFHEYKGWWLETGEPIKPEEWAVARAVRKHETSLNEKIEIECFDGTHKIILNSAVPVIDPAGLLLGAVILNEDITAETHLRRQVEAERARLQAVLESLPVGVVISDERGRLLMKNQELDRIFAGDAHLPEQIQDYNQGYTGWWPDTGQVVQPEEWPMAQALLTGQTLTGVELDVQRLDGTRAILLVSAAPVRDPSGRQIGGVVVDLDITERKQIEQELRAIEARQRRLIDANLVGVLYGRHGQITGANDAFLQTVGYTRAELEEGRLNWRDMTPLEFLPVDQRASAEAAERGACSPYEKEFIAKDGRRVPVLIGFTYLDNLRDEYASFVVDLTERKRAERNARFLADLGTQVLQSFDPAKRIETFLEMLGAYLGANRCLLIELDPDSNRVMVSRDFHRALPAMEGIYDMDAWPRTLAKELARGQTIVIPDTHKDRRLRTRMADFYDVYAIRSGVYVPRVTFEGWRATLLVTHADPHAWSEAEISLIRSAADVIWLALRNARLLADLRDTQRRFDIALRNAPIVVYTTDCSLRYTWLYNPQPGFEHVNFIGKTAVELFGEEAFRELEVFKRQVLETETGGRRECRVTDPTGRLHVFDVTCEPLRSPGGEMEGLAVSAFDVTGLRNMEHEMEIRNLHLELQRQIMQHREQERVEIARELHDGPLQEMIAFNFGLMEALGIDEKDQRLTRITSLQAAIQSHIRELRLFCSELRPPALAPFGLESAIRSHADTFREKYPAIRLNLDLMHDGKSLNEDLRLSLYRIYQELLNNVVRHSGASELTVRLWLDESEVTLLVEDNGRGFQVPSDWLDAARHGHLGLVGVQERADAIGGSLKIFSTPGRGTTVQVTAPRR